MSLRRLFSGLIVLAVAPLAACSSGAATPTTTTTTTQTTTPTTTVSAASSTSASATSASAAAEAAWPRTITHKGGSTEIKAKPQRIVATSMTLTGTLLAIKAPVVASAATTVGPMTDSKGFFSQWAKVADERGVKVLYPNLKLDMEAVEAAKPDLIVISSIGADATMDAYKQLSEIAPTIALDYGSQTWQEMSKTLGEATGHEADAAAAVADLDKKLTDAATKIKLPDQPVAVVSYNKAEGTNVFMPTSPQGSIMKKLGFTYIDVDTSKAAKTRSDVASYTAENAPVALAQAKTVFLLPLTGDPLPAFKADPLMANQPAVVSNHVYNTPASTFRLDYYSSIELVDKLLGYFPK